MELLWFDDNEELKYVKIVKDKFKKRDNVVSVLTNSENNIKLIMYFPRGSVYTKKIRKPKIKFAIKNKQLAMR